MILAACQISSSATLRWVDIVSLHDDPASSVRTGPLQGPREEMPEHAPIRVPITQFGHAHGCHLSHRLRVKTARSSGWHVLRYMPSNIVGNRYAEYGAGIVWCGCFCPPRDRTRTQPYVGRRKAPDAAAASDPAISAIGQIPLVDIGEIVADPFMNAPILIHERNDTDPVPAPESGRDADAPPAFERAPAPPRLTRTGLQEKAETVI